MRITSRTRVFAVLGDPVIHSLSPRMQNAAFQAAGLDAVYIALQPTADSLAGVMQALVAGGGGGNVTVPFKEIAVRVAGTRDMRTELLGAANVFAAAESGLQLGNTDVDGILATLDVLDIDSVAWHILGTGGSARAAAGAALARGARIAVRSRDSGRATAFMQWANSIGVRHAEPAECGVIINTTPLGLSATDVYPLEVAAIPQNAVVLDLVYGRDGPTAWVRACTKHGVTARDGRDVLLAQGAASWSFWFPGVAPPLEVMRAALNGSLG